MSLENQHKRNIDNDIIIIWNRVEVFNTENKVGLLYSTQDLVTVFVQNEFMGKDKEKLFLPDVCANQI